MLCQFLYDNKEKDCTLRIFKKFIRLLTVFFFFPQKPYTIYGLILLHIYSIFFLNAVVLHQSDNCIAILSVFCFFSQQNRRKKMFIIDPAVTQSCHVFALFCMSYLHSVLFPVMCMAAFSCFQLRSAPKGQNLLISVPTAQK